MHETVKNFVERVERARQERRQEPSEAELHEIARELGVTDAELAAARESVDEGLVRARGYLDHGLWQDALREISEVVDLAPSRVDLRHLAALAHAARFRQRGDEEARRLAAGEARACLELDATHQPSFTLLRELEAAPAARPAWKGPVAAAGGVAALGGAGAWMALAGTPSLVPALAATAVCAAAAWLIARRATRRGAAAVRATPGEPRRAAAAEDAPAEPAPVRGKPGRPTPEQNLDVEQALGLDAVSLWLRKSRLHRYPQSAYHEMVCELDARGPAQLDELELQLVYLDAGGAVIRRESRHALNPTQHAPLRPGDCHVFDLRVRFEPPCEPARLRIEAGAARMQNLPGPPGTAVPFALEWRVPRPPGVELVMRQREGFTDGVEPGAWVTGIWEIENTGTASVHDLDVELELVDESGAIRKNSACMMTYEDRPIHPGEVRLEKWLFTAEKGCKVRAFVRRA